MPKIAHLLTGPAALVLLTMAALPASAEQSLTQAADRVDTLDALLQQFEGREFAPYGGVRLDAWVETGEAGQEVVVMLETEGETRLVADPGITVTPTERAGVEWQLPLPYRMVDTGRDYFQAPATIRLPFTSADDEPLQLLVEYAYCFVDFQCFFGEAELTVATATPARMTR